MLGKGLQFASTVCLLSVYTTVPKLPHGASFLTSRVFGRVYCKTAFKSCILQSLTGMSSLSVWIQGPQHSHSSSKRVRLLTSQLGNCHLVQGRVLGHKGCVCHKWCAASVSHKRSPHLEKQHDPDSGWLGHKVQSGGGQTGKHGWSGQCHMQTTGTNLLQSKTVEACAKLPIGIIRVQIGRRHKAFPEFKYGLQYAQILSSPMMSPVYTASVAGVCAEQTTTSNTDAFQIPPQYLCW